MLLVQHLLAPPGLRWQPLPPQEPHDLSQHLVPVESTMPFIGHLEPEGGGGGWLLSSLQGGL